MPIIFENKTKEIHLYNEEISYIIKVLENHTLGNLYYGKRIRHQNNFEHLLQGGHRSLAVYNKTDSYFLSPHYLKLDFPTFGTGDFRYPIISVKQSNGSNTSKFEYKDHTIYKGKKRLNNLPSTYIESDQEATSIDIIMEDTLTGVQCVLTYSIYEWCPVITRSFNVLNRGESEIILDRALSLCLDLPDSNYDMITLEGAWSRERHINRRKIVQGVQGVYSLRGISSSEHNPFLCLARTNTDENSGEAIGFSLVYSGNHLSQVEVSTHNITRVLMGIHPDNYEWKLKANECFQTPEAVMVYSDKGFNGMSQCFHKLYRKRLVRGYWRNQNRPILINNWEATEMDFTEALIIKMAKKAQQLGIQLFVLDDGWFGKRDDDKSSLGDWFVENYKKLPNGIGGLAKKIRDIGMDFGLWIEPEMVSIESQLFKKHPDWMICAPGRTPSPSRNQYVLDYSREEVIDYIYRMLEKVIVECEAIYIKWDMNRYITECYSNAYSPEEQGKVYHKYILGVYALYEKLISRFPNILFESCSSGGARYDPGMLYYAPQTWASDNTDAMERLKIQYGTSMVYPLSSIGAHVSQCPNLLSKRDISIKTRGNVALFGTFGYEMDLNKLSESELETVREQIIKSQKLRTLINEGLFYRILSPFEGEKTAWMVVSDNKKEAIVGYYTRLNYTNRGFQRLPLKGLCTDTLYMINYDETKCYYGDELMHVGMIINDKDIENCDADFSSVVYELRAVEQLNE